MTMDTTAAKSTEELDAQLLSTLRDIDPHNYAYLFERCKRCNVNARHLRFFKKDQIHELIPKSELGILVEFEYLLNLWQISKGYASFDTKIQLNRDDEINNLNNPNGKPQAQSNLIISKEEPHIPSNNQAVVVAKQAIDIKPISLKSQGPQISSPAMVADEVDELLTVLRSDENSKTSNAKHMKFNEDDDEEQFTLEKIIPELLKELKCSYESKSSLSTRERRLLCSSIVDYFVSRKIKFNSYTMAELAEQIVEHFPKEHKNSWCNHVGGRTCGRFYLRLRYLRKKVRTNSASSKDKNDEEKFTLETIIPELLKELKCSYESKNSLSINERRLLCSSIVDYFVSRKIKFSSNTMDVLAEQIVEHFPKEDKKSWCNRDGPRTRSRFFFRFHNSRKNMAKQTNNTSTSKVTLESIIPELLKELKDSYESKDFLSANERSLLCGSIVDYFENRKIKFSSDIMDELAEQIVEHFPAEDKKSWCNRDGPRTCGRFYFRFHNSRRNMRKQANNTSTSKVVTNSTSSEGEYDEDQFVTNSTSREPESREEVHDEDSKSIQAWLKFHKCESFSEMIDLWEDTMKYRCRQSKHLKDLDSIREFLNNWPSYKLDTAQELLTMDFSYLYPQAMETFRTRWLVYKQNIEQFLKVELKDVNCIKLLAKYQLQKATINEDSSSCILIYLVHAITKPLRHFEVVNGNVSYTITDSRHSMMRLIRHKAEIDEYTEPYPCIFVVGDSMLEVQECYVVFMDLHYKLSYENCLAVCVQIFTILKVEDPPASQCFWEFIRGYMFNIAKDKEKFNLATENMVNYLETVASSV